MSTAEHNPLQDVLASSKQLLVCRLKTDGTIVFANEAYADYFGKNTQNIVGGNSLDFAPTEEKQKLVDCVEQILNTQREAWLDHRAINGQGAIGFLRCCLQPQFDEDGSIREIVAIGHDLTSDQIEHEANERYRQSLKAAVAGGELGIWDWNVMTGEVFFNDRWAEMLGYRLEELESNYETWARLVHPDDLEPTASTLQDHVNGKIATYEAEIRMRHKDGHWVWVLTKGLLLEHDGQGQPIRVSGTHLDITQRKQTEVELNETKLRQDLAIEGSQIGVWDLNFETQELIVNKYWARMLGHEPEELEPHFKEWESRMHPDDLSKTWASFEEHVKNKTDSFQLEIRMRHKDGHWVWVLDRGRVASWSEDGRPLRVIGTHLDITKRKQAIQELEESERRLSSAIDGGQLATWDWDIPSGQVTYNDRWAKLVGCRPDELEPTLACWEGRLHPDDAPQVREALERHFSGQDAVYITECRLKHNDGSWIWVSGRGRVIDWTEDGKPQRMAGTNLDITARKLALQQMEDSERRLSFAIEGGELGTWDWDIESGHVEFNNRWAEMLGYAKEEVSPSVQTWEELLCPEDVEPTMAVLEQHFAGELEVYETEHRLKHKDGSWVWVLDKGRVIAWDEKGKPKRMCGTHLDITGRKEAQRRLQESERQMNLALEGGELGTFDVFVEDLRLRVGDRYAGMLGDTPETFGDTVEHWRQRIHPEDLAAIESSIQRNLTGEQPSFEAEYRMRHRDGHWVWVYDRARVVEMDTQGKAKRIAGTHLDITDRKHAEQAQQQLTDQLRLVQSAVENANDSILITDAELNLPGPSIVYVNPAFCKMTGYTQSEIIGQNPRILQGELTERKTLDQLRAALQRGEGYSAETVNYTKSHRPYSVEWHISPIKNDKGVITNWVSVQRDITIARAEEERQRQHTENVAHVTRLNNMGEMATGLAHELNQPLAAIANYMRGSLRRLDQGGLDQNALRTALERSASQAERAGEVIRRLRQFVSKRDSKAEPTDLQKLLDGVQTLVRPLLREHDVFLRLSIPDDVPEVVLDAIQIEQVLINLIRNAAEAMTQGFTSTRVITLSVALTSEELVMIRVSDTGPGMSAQQRDRLFEPFYTTKAEGMGMGLSICQSIIHSHGGRIEVQANAPSGTSFLVFLPLSSKSSHF